LTPAEITVCPFLKADLTIASPSFVRRSTATLTGSIVSSCLTDVLEKSIRSMGDLDHVESRSMDDISLILVELSSTVPLAELQQNWDILRRKVANVQAQLPAGAQPSTVMDDFGDVYGMFYAMTSDGFDYQKMMDYAQLVRRTVLDIDGVSSVDIYGERPACIDIDIQESKMANLGVHPAERYFASVRPIFDRLLFPTG